MEDSSSMDNSNSSSLDLARSVGTKIVALIDVDSYYAQMFKDFFEEEPASVIVYFGLGKEFLKSNHAEISAFDFLVVNHNLFDMKGVELIRKCRPHIKGKVCVISNFGSEISEEVKEELEISGDFEKTEGQDILNWYHNTSKEEEVT